MAMTLRTDSELEKALDTLVREENTSKQDAIRRAVIEKAKRYERKAELASISAAAREEWAETLHRLGTV